jgi:predicted acetyltransferase
MSEKIADRNQIQLIPAGAEFKSVIKNLARFYVYELSRFHEEDIPDDGLYEPYETSFNFDHYWQEPEHYPFIVRIENKLAGFVLINKKGSSDDIDWYLAEFYIIAKFQHKGFGRLLAFQLFKMFSGNWEISQMPTNLPAIKFWRSVLDHFTKGNYTEQRIQIEKPNPHEMITHKFRSF